MRSNRISVHGSLPSPIHFWRTIILAERLERLSWSGTYSLKTWSLHYFLIVNAFYLVQEGLQQCTVAPRCILDVSLSHLQSAFVICLLRGPCTPVQFAESPLRYSIPPSLPSLRKPLWESLLTPLLAAAITIGSTSLPTPCKMGFNLQTQPRFWDTLQYFRWQYRVSNTARKSCR